MFALNYSTKKFFKLYINHIHFFDIEEKYVNNILLTLNDFFDNIHKY